MIINKNIDGGKPFDWGKTSADYAKFRDIYPDEFYQKIISLNICTKGQTVLDLGTGTGVLPRNLYKYGANFIGADISENQICYAKKLSEGKNLDIDYVVASAENFDFPDETFDVVTACQCFWYFNNEIAIPKIYNVLKKDGHFAILVMAWLPGESDIAKKSEELVLKYNPSWQGANWTRKPIITTEWAGDMFEIEDTVNFDVNVNFTPENWHGRIKACRGIGASSLSNKEISDWEKEHLGFVNTLAKSFDILHYCTIINLKKKS